MKTEAPDLLLSAVLDEDAAFRRTTLQQTVALARHRRRTRFASRALAVAAVLSVAASLLRPPPSVSVRKPVAATPSLRVVRSVPLAAGESVRTRAALFARVTSQSNTFTRIDTRTSPPRLDYLNDKQLLAAFAAEHPALVASGTAEARLVFH